VQKLQQTAASNRSLDLLTLLINELQLDRSLTLSIQYSLLLFNANPFMHPRVPCPPISPIFSKSTPPRKEEPFPFEFEFSFHPL